MDGLKTGFTDNAGYGLTATARRNNMRLISVVMGEETSEIRSKDTVELLDYGYNNYKLKTIFKNNIKLGKVKVNNGKKDYVDLKLLNDVKTKLTLVKQQITEKAFQLVIQKKKMHTNIKF